MVSAGVACCSKNTIRRDTMKKVLLIALLAMLAVGMVFASGNDVLTGSSQQALGALRAVAGYPDKDLWWLGQDIAQIGLDEGYKCIAASSYNYKAVMIGLVEAFQGGKLGGELIPMNFSNGGFIWAWNEKCTDKITAEIKAQVEAKMAEFTAKADTLSNWSDVDYSKL